LAGKSKLVQIDYSSVYTHDLCYFLTNLQVLQRKKKEKKTIKERITPTINEMLSWLINYIYKVTLKNGEKKK